MPADPDPQWFVLPYQWRGWWHADGWVVYPSGHTEPWPAGLNPLGNPPSYYGYEGRVPYNPFSGPGSGNDDRWGGHTYYRPDAGYAVNSANGTISQVGLNMQPFWDPLEGYDVVWEPVALKPTQVQRKWKVTAILRPHGAQNMPVPWWNGRIYPEWPPLRRGRPRKPPAP
jgi:hypothetical protein